jgi:hypothetical protein
MRFIKVPSFGFASNKINLIVPVRIKGQSILPQAVNTNGKKPWRNVDGLVKSPLIVMPDLIRHPEPIEFTGFRLPPE